MAAISPFAAYAHEDTPLVFGSDGALSGLPKKYGETRLLAVFSDGTAGVLQEVAVEIAGRRTRLRHCLVSMLRTRSRTQIHVSASWYHEANLSPPYLQVAFFDDGFDPDSSESAHFSLRFSLQDGSLIGGSRVERSWWRRRMGVTDLVFREICPAIN